MACSTVLLCSRKWAAMLVNGDERKNEGKKNGTFNLSISMSTVSQAETLKIMVSFQSKESENAAN